MVRIVVLWRKNVGKRNISSPERSSGKLHGDGGIDAVVVAVGAVAGLLQGQPITRLVVDFAAQQERQQLVVNDMLMLGDHDSSGDLCHENGKKNKKSKWKKWKIESKNEKIEKNEKKNWKKWKKNGHWNIQRILHEHFPSRFEQKSRPNFPTWKMASSGTSGRSSLARTPAIRLCSRMYSYGKTQHIELLYSRCFFEISAEFKSKRTLRLSTQFSCLALNPLRKQHICRNLESNKFL